MYEKEELPALGTVRLWLVRTDGGPADASAGTGAGVLDEDELRRAAAFRFDRHRVRYIASHVALRTVLGERLGRAPGDVRLVRLPCPGCGEPHGRPAVADAPDLHFSLSHSGDLALVAVAPTAVGADVEELPSIEVTQDLAAVLHPMEQAELAALDAPSEHRGALARAWVRKEAYLKGIGTGLSRAADLDYVGTLPGSPGAPDGWTIRDVAVPAGYTAAVAVAP
ncbi:4'-phosphopantetheinyl transferase superfamily protein [Streptomyces sp. VRA16 Mangrove soil]|uniref:4'-phosphopantetheinyl transferase family protein n=1 Tax=Streptomyces sp. VRA16 Mangrove soil TaxID=2817434 RepID=UPI001A9F963E|nr:4'-phosphopantetheinyl transferase superfamily protein [Streptomyces sp. VRA16 Mangrove soil]MBO1337978.1 4'-phosphopantetheinyl transferase superfamily protein [Streptomyces sp. VRA16 Mangrove soil]